jgi:hypothetical protein
MGKEIRDQSRSKSHHTGLYCRVIHRLTLIQSTKAQPHATQQSWIRLAKFQGPLLLHLVPHPSLPFLQMTAVGTPDQSQPRLSLTTRLVLKPGRHRHPSTVHGLHT